MRERSAFDTLETDAAVAVRVTLDEYAGEEKADDPTVPTSTTAVAVAAIRALRDFISFVAVISTMLPIE